METGFFESEGSKSFPLSSQQKEIGVKALRSEKRMFNTNCLQTSLRPTSAEIINRTRDQQQIGKFLD